MAPTTTRMGLLAGSVAPGATPGVGSLFGSFLGAVAKPPTSIKPVMPTGNYQPTISGKPDYNLVLDTLKAGQTNSGNWANATPEQQKALHDANTALYSGLGATYDANGNWSLNGLPLNGSAAMSPEYIAALVGGKDYDLPASTITNPETANNASSDLYGYFLSALNQQGSQNAAVMQALQDQASKQAQAIADLKAQSLNSLIKQLQTGQESALLGVKNSTEDAKQNLEDTNFQRWLEARQNMADRGLAGSGLASDQDTRLLLQRDRDLSGVYRDAARQSFDITNRFGQQLDQAQRDLAGINPDEISSGIFQNLLKDQTAGMTDQAKLYLDALKSILPYDYATMAQRYDRANNQNQQAIDWARVDLDRWKTLGYMQVGDKLVPTQAANEANQRLALDEAKARGYFVNSDGSITPTEDANHNRATENLGQSQLVAQMNQWAVGNQLDAGRLALNQAEFQHKMDYDQSMLDKASATLALDQDKTQLDALKTQLSGIDTTIRTYITQGQQPPVDLVNGRNAVINSINSLFTSAPKTATAGPLDLGGTSPASSSGSNPTGNMAQYRTWINQGGSTAGVRPDVLWNMMMAESNGNPNAVSSAGAQGLMQFMPETAKGYGIDPFNPQQAISGATRYMSDMLNHYNGDYAKAVAAYNAGQGTVDAAVRKYGAGWRQALPGETKRYLQTVLGQ